MAVQLSAKGIRVSKGALTPFIYQSPLVVRQFRGEVHLSARFGMDEAKGSGV